MSEETEQKVFKDLAYKILHPPYTRSNHYVEYEEYYDKLLVEIDETLTKYPKLINLCCEEPFCSNTNGSGIYFYSYKHFGNLLHVACKTFYVCDKIIKLLIDRGFDTVIRKENGRTYEIPLYYSRFVKDGRTIGDHSDEKYWSRGVKYYISHLPNDIIDLYSNILWRLKYDVGCDIEQVALQALHDRKLELQKQYYEKLLIEQKEKLLEELYKPPALDTIDEGGLGYKIAKRRFEGTFI